MGDSSGLIEEGQEGWDGRRSTFKGHAAYSRLIVGGVVTTNMDC